MKLSCNCQVVVVDDKYESDAKPLIEVLAKNSVPCLYYDGTVSKLPAKPMVGIRFVFLDLDLKGAPKSQGAGAVKTMVSYAAAVLCRLISKMNGPYAIIFWSKHSTDDDAIAKTIKLCRKSEMPPVAFFDLGKHECKNTEGEYDFNLISDTLKIKLASIGAFQLYIAWENALYLASSRFLASFSALVPNSEKWSANTSALIHKLYKTYVTDNELTDKSEQFRCACHLMNRSFLTTLEQSTRTDIVLPVGFELMKGDVDSVTTAKLNTTLFLDEPVNRHVPGSIYRVKDKNLRKALTKIVFPKSRAPNGVSLYSILITPECDIAQNKTVKLTYGKNKQSPIHRIVFAVMYASRTGSAQVRNKFNDAKKRTDARFPMGPFWIRGKQQFLIANFSTLSLIEERELPRKAEFILKRDLLFDLQTKAANHVNRLGNFQLE
ncbi:MAG: hypothetical protein A2Y13_09475 [Planctomycetes bacterium GWC2_45_44]|nr:MAG: hypothetical protein A2Y13_09475 [Planctomycetes bacterium GWC2_45_44]